MTGIQRERTLSGGSDMSDHFHDINERRVDDISLEIFYRPHTLTLLLLSISWLVYEVFTRDDSVIENNFANGLRAVVFFFFIVSLLAFPNGPFTRPHPAFWRFIFGVSVLYVFLLIFTIFQNYHTVKAMLSWASPDLQNFTLVVKHHAHDCWNVTPQRIWNSMDVYAFGHVFGWALKAIVIRHWGVCIVISVTWEITEVTFCHLLPNFAECWWDMLFLDILICNNLGIALGMGLCHFLEMRTFYWESIKDIQGTTGKLKRCVMQFTPASWGSTCWLDPYSSYMRVIGVSILVIFFHIVELNTFFLKHIFGLPTNHLLNFFRIILIIFISAPSIRQYYSYITDTRCKRLGMQAWVFVAVSLSEVIVSVKFGMETFKTLQLDYMLAWIASLLMSTMVCLYLVVKMETRLGAATWGSSNWMSTPVPSDGETTPVPSPRRVTNGRVVTKDTAVRRLTRRGLDMDHHLAKEPEDNGLATAVNGRRLRARKT